MYKPSNKRCCTPTCDRVHATTTHRNTARNAKAHVRQNVLEALKSGTAHQRKCAARIARCKVPPLTCIEVCVSSGSRYARQVKRNGGAALRVLWPPPTRQGRKRRMTSEAAERLEADRRQNPRKPPKLLCRNRIANWYLNMDWESHQKAFRKYLRTLEPAKGTAGLAFHTSPMCRMFCAPQRLAFATGSFDRDAHAIALQRLRCMRAYQRTILDRAKRKKFTCVRSHEQPPMASVDFDKAYEPQGDWPYAISSQAPRQSINGCMVGARSASLPVWKGWTFECDHEVFAAALGRFKCDRQHLHARSTLNPKAHRMKSASAKSSSGPKRRFNVGEFEEYPLFLGSLLAFAAAYTVACKRLNV